MKPGVKIGLGVMVSFLTIGFIFFYDFYLKERIDSEEVVVVKAGTTIQKTERIDKKHLMIERRPKASLIEDVVLAKDINKIVGNDARHEMVGNQMISMSMIDFDDLVPDTEFGEAIRPITSEWIYAQPGSLRRKDKIDIYLVRPDGSTNLTQNGPTQVVSVEEDEESEEEGTETAANPVNTNGNENTESTNESGSTEESQDNVSIERKPFLQGVRVVYVKDSSNKEVVSSSEEGSANQDKRLNGSSTISDLEVILNEEDFAKLIEEVLGKGSKLYITYQ
ncbi:hypothetical protein [Ferdinandcohnia sp. SAFN-114]|uniref:hypothetical protein n=1 Tax=Ferdinandcohnia sp. SAFN-114 TaxID=3387275 RepID=UPI003F80CBBE